MQKIGTFLICVLLFQSSFSQEKDTINFQGFKGFKEKKIPFQHNVIKTGISSWLVGTQSYGELRFVYERMIAQKQSLILGVSYNYLSPFAYLFQSINKNIPHYKVNGIRGQLGYRFYPIKHIRAPEGFYFGPHFSYDFIHITDKSTKDFFIKNNFFAVASTGYQIKTRKNVFLDFNVGLGYQKFWGSYTSYSTTHPVTTPLSFTNNIFQNNFKIMTQINIGFGW